MAKQMSYTDQVTGVVYPDSVWFPVGVYIDVSGPSVKVDFLGYKDAATAAGVLGKSFGAPGAQSRGAIGVKSYNLTPAQFVALSTSDPNQGSLLNDLAASCYEIALSTFDVQDPAFPEDLTKKVSFFSGAADVTIN